MKFTETLIHGCFLVEAEKHQDSRGFFFRTFDKEEYKTTGLQREFIQHNVSVNFRKGTIRGMHFQHAPHAETKLVQCMTGKICDIVIDLRRHSPTLLKWISIELTGADGQMLLVPDGCAHGFQTLEDNSVVQYYHTGVYSKSSEGGVRYNDPALKISWPEPVTEISERDQNHPLLNPGFGGIEL